MIANDPFKCPDCGELAAFSKKRGKHFCAECELEFVAPVKLVDPQTIFLSYAHKSEREEDFDVSEELVLLIKAELDKDGHRVWIDKEGIRSGFEWRERITSAILEHTHFLSFLSRRSVRDPGVCLNEIATALGHTRNIQTVLAGPESQVSPPLTISHLQWHDFQDWREIQAGTKTGANGEGWDAWFSQRMELVRDTVGNAQNAQASGQLQRLKDILVPSGFEARIVQKTEGFFGRQWLFDATQDWLDNSTSRMFWLKASPGIGKSAFAAKLTHQARSAVIGFFMCDFQGMKNPEDSAREAICTLAFQMASRLPDYRAKLIYQQQVDNEKILKKSADDLFEYLITEPLNKSGKIPEATRLCLVIDGLDEAGRGNGNNALADLLVKHVNRLPEWLGVVVTSRPEPYLEQILKPLSGISVDGQTQQNQQDLVAWIEEKLPKHIQGEERQRVLDVVLEKSGGTFLYLRLVEEDKTLDISQPESLPDKLDGIFKQNFNRYFPDAQEYGNKTEPFLRLLVAAPGPLPEQMGRQVLAWSQRDLTLNVTEPMGSLLQQRDGGLVFFHASLSDWLKEPKRSGTHCINDTGGKELGEFVWRQFEAFENSQWQVQVVQWLATLMQHTYHWGEVKDLNRVADFLSDNLRHRDAISVRQRELALIVQTIGSDSEEAGDCLHLLGDTLDLLGDSSGALEKYHTAHDIRERLLAKDPDNAGWQRDLSVSYNRIGGILEVQGDLSAALIQFAKGLKICESLAAKDPEKPEWQSGLSLSYNRIGAILQAQGDLSAALIQFGKGLKIRENLVARDPDKPEWQSGLGITHRCIGGILEVQGDLSASLEQYAKNLEINERLATENPDNANWQSELGEAHRCIGDILEAQGDLSAALLQFGKALVVSERLAAKDPDNADVQSVLGAHYLCKGNILEMQGDLFAAREQFGKSLEICKRLVVQDPDQAFWQRNLSVAYNRLGWIMEQQGDLSSALLQFGKSLEIRKSLAAHDPANANWQRDLRGSHRDIGYILESQGDLSAALVQFGKELDICERLAAMDPENMVWQRDLSVAYNGIGGVLVKQGDLSGALVQFAKCLQTCECRAAKDPANAGWQRDLGVSYSRIGEILEAQGDLSAALVQFEKELDISKHLAAMDPENMVWQRDLGLSYIHIGSILKSQGDLTAALVQFDEDLKIREHLVAKDPDHLGWQRDLGLSYNRIGGILEIQGDLPAALEQFGKFQEISERLTDKDPDNVLWQSNLILIHNCIGGILEKQGALSAALVQFGKGLEISERLAAKDPNNVEWRRDLGISNFHIGGVLQLQGQIIAAQSEYLKGSNIFVQLSDPDDAGSLIDHAAGLAGLASCHSASGKTDLALELDLQIAAIDWKSDAIVGVFRRKAIPNIVARLDGIFDQCVPELQARVARRCLAGLEVIGVADLEVWRARVAQAPEL